MPDASKDLTQNFEIHSNKHASCDRRHVIMVHAIIRIMKSSHLLDSNSNHECLNLNTFYNF